jgi:hypothetical protein
VGIRAIYPPGWSESSDYAPSGDRFWRKIEQDSIAWESGNALNPAAIVKNGSI